MTMAVNSPDSTPPEEPPSPHTDGGLASDILLLFFKPSALFSELPRCNRSVGALLVLMLSYVAYAFGIISTGVLDYEIDRNTQKEIGYLRQHHQGGTGDEDSEKLTSLLDSAEKGAIFRQQITRVNLIVGGPLSALVSLSLLSGVLFMIIALRGGKPNYQLLFGVTVFAALVEMPNLIIRLLLTAQLQVSRVETSAAAFISGPEAGLSAYLLLRRLDPFAIWFYVLVGMGLYYTGQMSRRGALISACVLGLLAAVIHASLDIPELAEITLSLGQS